MSDIDQIKELREATGAGVLDAKNALQEAGGNLEQAVMILRKAGQKVAAKKAERATREGAIGSYVHATGKVAALVAVACETDFVARNPDFQALAHDLALHAAATQPQYIRLEDIPESVLEQEREVARAELTRAGKPEAMWDKIISGKLEKFAAENCFLKQNFVKDETVTIEQLIQQSILKLGENIQVREVRTVTL